MNLTFYINASFENFCRESRIKYIQEIQHKETALETVWGLFKTLHLVACMESNDWLMNWCLFECVCR